MKKLLILLAVVTIPLSAFAQSAGDYVIGPQDVLQVAVFDQPDLGGKYSVELDGGFTFPLIGRVTAGGLTTQQVEDALKKKLQEGFFKNPQVTVSVDQYRSQRIFVTGEVRNPGAYALTGDMTLIEALAKAGSTLQSASDEVLVVRGGKDATEAIIPDAAGARDIVKFNLEDLQSGAEGAKNIALKDGDTIYVAKAELVYVFGQVKNPAAYGMKSDTTVLQALSMAGGVTPNGAMNRTRIIRIINGDKKELKANLTDVVLPGDTIMVPERFF
jgi:polysaccharide export outer membrane protein